LMVVAFSLAITASGCAGEDALEGGGGNGGGGGEGDTVVVGSANFSEQLILGNMYAELLEDRGVEVERRLNIGSRNTLFPALESGEITLVPEYTGALLVFLEEGEEGEMEVSTPEEVTERLGEALPEELMALEPAEAQNRGSLAVLPETSEEYDLETYSDLAEVADELVAGGPPEFPTRYSGLVGLQEVYGIEEFGEFRALDAGGPLTSEALSSGQIDVARVFTTQGVINDQGWIVLEDDRNMELAQNIIPIIRDQAVTDEIQSALNELSSGLTTENLIALNERVEVDRENPDDVARDYLEENGLVE
ncbi:MAG: ABC transporter substrate-binding protein, partial [Rubrobacter sp.]|nr:ABC transporter substrate-binding protein [Rubrobacter sp.]